MRAPGHGSILAALLCLAAPAGAQGRDDQWSACGNRKDAYSHDQRRAAFSALIESPAESPRNRATAYLNRSLVSHERGEEAETLADLEQAIRFNPRFAMAFNNRGHLYAGRGDHALALEDYAAAIQFGPDLALPLVNRANLYRKLGDDARADADLAEAARVRELHGPTYRGQPITRPVPLPLPIRPPLG